MKKTRFKSAGGYGRFLRFAALITLSAALWACASSGPGDRAAAPASEEQLVAGLQIVDCLLPGQLRKLGNTTYLTARRPIKTTASDCNIRGGEYVAYDRADYKTALKVWLPAAEAGDAEAQVNVGEIFEKGLGSSPNYEAAMIWYEKAAAQENKRAQFNLGTMYEQGLGVPEDRLQALNYYRQAWGLPEDSVMFQDTARREREALQAELQQQIASKDAQLRLLEKQIKSLKAQLGATRSSAAPANAELETLAQLVASLRADRDQAKKKLSAMPRLRTPTSREAPANTRGTDWGAAQTVQLNDMAFGKYYALVIGNRDYSQMDDLETPRNDATEIAKILQQQYGFEVQLMLDADRLSIMQAINELHATLDEDSNLLLYYAGHGSLVDVGERDTGYWLPVNANPPPNDAFWVPNEFVTNHLGRLKARRVLVIADSCYGGLLSSSPGHLFLGNRSASGDLEYIRYKLPRRSRLLLSSGGDKPVIDNGGGGHSVFARELIGILRDNTQVLSAPDLFASIRGPVMQRASENNFVQEPVYKSIKGAGHEVGDFFFVPQRN